MTTSNLSIPPARVVGETLTDGSKVFNLSQTVGAHRLTFACVSETHAQQLAALLDECADVTVDDASRSTQ